MAEIKETRRRFTTFLIAMLIVDAICVGILLSPIGRGSREGRQVEDNLQTELTAKTRETVPLRGLDNKIVTAREQIKNFYSERFPQTFAAVPERLNKLATANGVTLSAVKYDTYETDTPGLRGIRVQAAVDGDYFKAAKFINAVERDKTFFIIDNVAIGEQKKGGVHLQMVFETYVGSQTAS